MAYSINRQPLLRNDDDSEFEDDLETEVDNSNAVVCDQKPFLKSVELSDKYYFTYIIFYLLGMNTQIPWSFFITADDYWMYKFREIHVNNTGRHNYTHTENLEKRSDLQASFTSYISVAGAIPSTIFMIINAFISKKVPLKVRITGSQFMILLLFILTTAFIKVNTDEWQDKFLLITLLTVAFVNVASAVYGGSLMGIAGRFSSKYITATMAGQALGGVFTALAQIGSLWIGASPVFSGLLYFIIGDVMIFLSLTAYIILEKTAFFKHYMLDKLPDRSEPNFLVDGEVRFSQEHTISYMHIFKKTWHCGISMFLVFVATLTVYPAVTVLVESQDKGRGYAWNDIYFVPVVTYLIFSLSDYVGRIVAGIFEWPRNKPWQLIFLCTLRILFIPIIMVCNAQPRHHLPVYIHADIYYILISIIFAISNGYICNTVLIIVPRLVNAQEKEIASTMMGAFLGLGLAVGSTLSLFMVKIL